MAAASKGLLAPSYGPIVPLGWGWSPDPLVDMESAGLASLEELVDRLGARPVKANGTAATDVESARQEHTGQCQHKVTERESVVAGDLPYGPTRPRPAYSTSTTRS
jgi:hypothetical protein